MVTFLFSIVNQIRNHVEMVLCDTRIHQTRGSKCEWTEESWE